MAIALVLGAAAVANQGPKVLENCGGWFNPATGTCEGLPDPAANPADWWCTSSPAPLIGDPSWAADHVHEHPCTRDEFSRLCDAVRAQVAPGDQPPSRPPCGYRSP